MKKALFAVLFACLCAWTAYATQVMPRELSDLVRDADHVIIGKVVKVDMVDEDGKQVSSRKGRTGPGLTNQLRLHVEIAEAGIFRTNAEKKVASFIVPLWQAWHYTLGQWKDDAEGKTYIFLLKGKDYLPVYPGLFLRQMSDEAEIKQLLKEDTVQNKPDAGNGR